MMNHNNKKRINHQSPITNFLLISVPTLLFLFIILELFFQFVIIAADHPTYDFNQEYGLLKFDPNGKKEGYFTQGKMGEHLAKWSINNVGWISDIDYHKKKKKYRVCVIGDSYIEAKQVNTGENFAQLLHHQLKDSIEFYNFGVSGAPLSQYFFMLKYIEANYHPDLIIINVIHNDFIESIYEYTPSQGKFWTHSLADSLKPIRPTLSLDGYRLKSIIKKSALARYIVYNLNIKFSSFKKSKELLEYENNVNVAHVTKAKVLTDSVCGHILKEIKKFLPNRKILFIMDAPRTALYKNNLSNSKVSWMNESLKKHCILNGFEDIDLTQAFISDYEKNKIKFEFPMDGHWTKRTHQLVSNLVLPYVLKYYQEGREDIRYKRGEIRLSNNQ